LTSTASATVLEPLRDAIARVDPNVPVFDAMTIEHFYDVRSRRMGGILVRLVASLGVMGVTLAAIGLYGLVGYAVGRRTREIGVRIAVGAGPWHVVGMVLRDGMPPAYAGVAVGVVLSIATVRLLPRIVLVGHIDDVPTLMQVVPLLLVVTLVAAFIPARRAAQVDPTISLRAE